MKNLNLLFNKLYYEDIEYDSQTGKIKSAAIKTSNKALFSSRFNKSDYTECPIPGAQTFILKTTYPGLLAGIGNPHDGSDDDASIKVGFSFDYTTGQPYIPGSTVKGVLRSSFRNHPEITASVYNEIFKNENASVTEEEITKLEEVIFDDNDIFFDAVIYDSYGELVSGDTITPHGDDVTKNPIPVQILRINPGVKLEFRFKLSDDGIPANQKEKLFKELLKLFGIGAKTNVGYGHLEDTDSERPAPKTKPVHNPTGQTNNNNNNYRSNNHRNGGNNFGNNRHGGGYRN